MEAPFVLLLLLNRRSCAACAAPDENLLSRDDLRSRRFCLRQPLVGLGNRGTFLFNCRPEGTRFSALRAENCTQKIGKYHAAARPERSRRAGKSSCDVGNCVATAP